tara:strand:+ start:184 stop:1008 length:825 start_codon:yes stop_codon:yes gene_type:complete
MNIIEMYSNWLRKQNVIHRKKFYTGYEKYHSASSAGHCYKKQLFRFHDIKGEPFSDDTLRILRMGTILHKDFEETIVDYLLENIDVQDKYFIFVEHEVLSPELNVRGHLDFAYIDKENRHLTVIDFKSVGSFKWRGKFGHLKNRDKEPSFKYEMQLGTYALAMKNIYGKYISHSADNMELKIIWYNKDTSRMREQLIPPEFMKRAKSYWEDFKDIQEKNDLLKPLRLDDKEQQWMIDLLNERLPRDSYGIPFEGWECHNKKKTKVYCQWESVCK